MRAQHGRRPLHAVVSALLVLIASVIVAAGTSADKKDLFDEIYQRSLPQASTLKTIRARFTETTT